MLSRKMSYSPKSLKFYFALFISIGFLNCSRAGDLTVLANVPAASSTAKSQTSAVGMGERSIVLFHEKWRHRSLNLCASYEEPWRDSAVAAKISDGHQEGGCAFIKASFSF